MNRVAPRPGGERNAARWIVVLTGVSGLLVAMDMVVLTTALSRLRVALGASVEELEWTVNGYNLSLAVLLITGAALGDRYGRRRVYAGGLGLFAAASAAGAMAPDVGTLIAARVVQGAGAALIMPLGLALLTAAFPPEKRGAAIGMFSAITGLAVATGPLVGGAVVQGIDWQVIFWINVPVALGSIPLVLIKVRESYGPANRLDLPGLALVSSGAMGIVWALMRGNHAGWASPEVIASGACGIALLGGFVVWEGRAVEPMMPLQSFRSRRFSAGSAAVFLTYASQIGAVFFYAQLLQFALGRGPVDTGLWMLPWTAAFVIVAPIAGALADRIGERALIASGLASQATGMAWMALIAEPAMGYTEVLGPFVLAGIGISMAIPCTQRAVVGSVARDALAKAAGTSTTMRQLGGVVGLAIAVAVFAAHGSYASPATFTDGFRPAIGVAAALALLGALAGLAVPGRRSTAAPAPIAAVPALEPAS